MRVSPAPAFLIASCALLLNPCSAQAEQRPAKAQQFSHSEEREKANQNLLMVLGGPLGGPYIQLAQDIAVTTTEGDALRVIPVASDGAVKNVRDVLLLRGVYLGITSVQTLNALKASGELGSTLDRRIAYIAPLSVDMFHVLARPEISSLGDLKGKRASFNLKGSATAAFGPAVFKALGIEVEEVHATPNDAIQLMREGKLDAAVCLCPMPVPAFATLKGDVGFKFLEVPYAGPFEESYLPASVTGDVYPSLIAKGSQVRTIATSTILISFNWTSGTDGYRKVERFVDAFFSNFDKLRQPPRHPAWRSVNMAATIRGWERFPAAQRWLDRQAAEAKRKPQTDPPLAARGDAQERLFQEFLEWSRTRAKR